MLWLTQIKDANISSFPTTGVHLAHASQIFRVHITSAGHQKRKLAAAPADNKARNLDDTSQNIGPGLQKSPGPTQSSIKCCYFNSLVSCLKNKYSHWNTLCSDVAAVRKQKGTYFTCEHTGSPMPCFSLSYLRKLTTTGTKQEKLLEHKILFQFHT